MAAVVEAEHRSTEATVPNIDWGAVQTVPLRTKIRRWLTRPAVPDHIRAHFRHSLPADQLVASSLVRNYFVLPENHFGQGAEAYVATSAGTADLRHHVRNRLIATRERVVPWLDSARPLSGARILEIGCGTGSASLAFAEQGAQVTGLDLSEGALKVARDRLSANGLAAEFLLANALEAPLLFPDRQFDFIVFFASLEHMTNPERLAAMRSTWEMLPSGAFWCVVEAPNRLAAFDYHTSRLPFFHWLPDDLAYQYISKAERPEMQRRYDGWTPEKNVEFLRRGRGVSYHEFDLAIAPAQELDVVSSLELFLNERRLLGRLMTRFTAQHRTEKLLRSFGPPIHRGFYQSYLDLLIRKP